MRNKQVTRTPLHDSLIFEVNGNYQVLGKKWKGNCSVGIAK